MSPSHPVCQAHVSAAQGQMRCAGSVLRAIGNSVYCEVHSETRRAAPEDFRPAASIDMHCRASFTKIAQRQGAKLVPRLIPIQARETPATEPLTGSSNECEWLKRFAVLFALLASICAISRPAKLSGSPSVVRSQLHHLAMSLRPPRLQTCPEVRLGPVKQNTSFSAR